MADMQARFFHPVTKESLTLSLPGDTRFSTLTPLLCEQGFLAPQKPGYAYLYQEHLCNMNHTLADYVPAEAREISLEIFPFPQVLV